MPVLILDIDECSTNPCLYGGTCRDEVDAYVCECRDGYVGDTCQVSKYSSRRLHRRHYDVLSNVFHITTSHFAECWYWLFTAFTGFPCFFQYAKPTTMLYYMESMDWRSVTHAVFSGHYIIQQRTVLGPRLSRKTQTRLKTNLKLTMLNNTKLRNF